MPRGFKNAKKNLLNDNSQDKINKTNRTNKKNKAKKKQNDEKVIEYYDNEELIQWILCDSYIREQSRNKIYKENEDIINLYEYNINYYTNLIYDLQHIDNPEYYIDLKNKENTENLIDKYIKLKNKIMIELKVFLNTIENDIGGTEITLNDEFFIQQLELFETISQNSQ